MEKDVLDSLTCIEKNKRSNPEASSDKDEEECKGSNDWADQGDSSKGTTVTKEDLRGLMKESMICRHISDAFDSSSLVEVR